MNQPDTKTIADLRQELFSAIQGLKSGAVTLDQARAINELSKTIVDTAKVEVDYLRVTDGGAASFLEHKPGTSELPPGVTGITQHRIGR